MRVRLHLIAPPWAVICTPSVQLGVLQAYTEQELGDRVETRTYSAFLEILYRYRESSCLFFYEDFKAVGEEIYMLIYAMRYLRSEAPLKKSEVETFLDDLNSEYGWTNNTLDLGVLSALEKHTLAYVDEKIVPELIDDGVNVIGFTMNFSQVYASMVMARMIRERAPDKKFLFLFGGFSASLPNIAALLKKLEIPGYIVFGEGEKRLISVLRELLEQTSFKGELLNPTHGVFHTASNVDFHKRDESLFQAQLDNLDSLPLPAYEEYFTLYDRLKKSDPLFERLVPNWAVIEGTRGCFAKCDFCNHNFAWSKFRKQQPDQIFDRVQALRARYKVNRIYFVDNVCDTFAERLSERFIERGEKISFYMNLRAHHPEIFWKKLAAAGLNQCLIGIEAFSPPLLRHMSKGTLVIQNLRAMKYLAEHGVSTGSGLITHHPKATREDAVETLRILEEISHLNPLEQNTFILGLGSPLYDELDKESQRALVPCMTVKPPAALLELVPGMAYDLPPHQRLQGENARLWTRVKDQCRNLMRLDPRKRPVFKVTKQKNGALNIVDTRFDRPATTLTGLRAQLFELCHEGLTLEMLEQKLGLAAADFQDELCGMTEQRLLLLADRYYFTLAMR